jgi:hypothetical protein
MIKCTQVAAGSEVLPGRQDLHKPLLAVFSDIRGLHGSVLPETAMDRD